MGENMSIESVSLQTTDDFLAEKRIAMMGISRDPKHFSVTLFEDFRRRGYDVVPVNPHVPELFGQRCFARVRDADLVVSTTAPTRRPSLDVHYP